MILHVNICGTARSQREITGLPAFAAAPRPSPGLAPWSVRIKDLYFPSGPGATGLYRCSPGTAGTAVSGCRYDRPADRPGEDLIATAFGDGPRNPVTDQLARFALAAGVAYSRVHVGVHYPGDVVIGSVIGAGTAAMTAAACDRFLRRPGLAPACRGRRYHGPFGR